MKFDLKEALEILARTPSILRTQIQGLSPGWLINDYGQNTWSVHQVIGHLIWGERTDWIPRIKHILKHGNSVMFEPFDRSGHHSLCEASSTIELVDLFESARNESLKALRILRLAEVDFTKTGLHPTLGAVTLGQLMATWTVHDLNHIAQINKAMAFQCRDLVGPWRECLSILSPPKPA